MHIAYDYNMAYSGLLPSADYNKKVFEFDHQKPIWDQIDYEHRVRQEADIMVTLEALKAYIMHMDEEMEGMISFLLTQFLGE